MKALREAMSTFKPYLRRKCICGKQSKKKKNKKKMSAMCMQ